MTYKPRGYNTLSPYLIVAGADHEMDFMEKAFGAERLRRFDTPDGGVLHAEMRVGDTVVMLGDAGGDWHPVPCHMHMYVEDVDAVYRQALEAGGQSVQEPVRKGDDPDRRGGVLSPGGNTWWIATQKV